MKQVLVFLVIILFSHSLNAQNDTIDWVTDLNFIMDELPKKHYDLYFQQSEENFKNQINNLIDKTPNLTDYEILENLSQILARIGDSHTAVMYGPFNSSNQFLPCWYYWFSDGIYITYARDSFKELLGHQLISINGYPVEQIADSISTIIVIDNKSTVKKSIPRMIGFIPHLEYFGFSLNDSIVLTTKDLNDEIIKTVVHKSQLSKDYVIQYKPDSLAYCWENRNQFFTNTFFEQSKILYVQYSRCWGRELEKKFGSRERAKTFPSFSEFQKDIFKQIEKQSIEKVIFDLRFNVGGSSIQGTQLIEKLSKNTEINQKGKLYVITGKHTYSSGIINTMDFKEKTNAIFVGEVTSGRPNHYGEVKYLTLPSSGLKVNYSTKYFNKYKPDTDAFYPDIEIETSFENYKTGVDPVFEYIRGL